VGSVAILTCIFGFAIVNNTPHLLTNEPLGGGPRAGPFDWNRYVAVLPPVLVIVLTGFVLHELAHKVVAQRYYLWAEYRAQWAWLGIVGAVNVAQPTPLPFALPGFVQIVGDATVEDNGRISVVGPATNLAIAFLAFPFLVAEGGRGVALAGAPHGTFLELLVMVNAGLAAFNLLPVSVLDGAKILRWRAGLWLVLMLLALALFLTVANRLYVNL